MLVHATKQKVASISGQRDTSFLVFLYLGAFYIQVGRNVIHGSDSVRKRSVCGLNLNNSLTPSLCHDWVYE